MLPCFPELTLDDIALKETSELIILAYTFDTKLTFERHVRSVSSSASQRIGVLRRACNIFDSAELMQHCFRRFMLPILEYASVGWYSAAVRHLGMLGRMVNRCSQLMDDVVPYCLDNRRSVAGLVCCIRFVIESISFCFLALFPFSVIDLRNALRLFMSLLWFLVIALWS